MHVLVKNLFTKFSDFRAVGSYTRDVADSVIYTECIAVSVCWRCAKTAEVIEISFVMYRHRFTLAYARNHYMVVKIPHGNEHF